MRPSIAATIKILRAREGIWGGAGEEVTTLGRWIEGRLCVHIHTAGGTATAVDT